MKLPLCSPFFFFLHFIMTHCGKCDPSPTCLRVVVETMTHKHYYSILCLKNYALVWCYRRQWNLTPETMGFVLDVVKLLQVLIKNCSIISWQVMFFKHEKSRMGNFNFCSYNKCFGEKIVNPLIQFGLLFLYPKEKKVQFSWEWFIIPFKYGQNI